MKYIKRFNEELSNKYKDEVEILYKDKNMVCLIPKSQMMSYIYGFRTKWCSVSKTRFDIHTKDYQNLLIRFLFKEKNNEKNQGSFGYKLRLTYNPCDKNFDWADASGLHCLKNKGNPFIIKEVDKYNPTEKISKIIEKIESIPEECKNIIFKYLNNEKQIDYKHRDVEYTTNNTVTQKQKYLEFKADTMPALLDLIKDKSQYYLETSFDAIGNNFIIRYSYDSKKTIQIKELSNFYKFEDELIKIIDSME